MLFFLKQILEQLNISPLFSKTIWFIKYISVNLAFSIKKRGFLLFKKFYFLARDFTEPFFFRFFRQVIFFFRIQKRDKFVYSLSNWPFFINFYKLKEKDKLNFNSIWKSKIFFFFFSFYTAISTLEFDFPNIDLPLDYWNVYRIDDVVGWFLQRSRLLRFFFYCFMVIFIFIRNSIILLHTIFYLRKNEFLKKYFFYSSREPINYEDLQKYYLYLLQIDRWKGKFSLLEQRNLQFSFYFKDKKKFSFLSEYFYESFFFSKYTLPFSFSVSEYTSKRLSKNFKIFNPISKKSDIITKEPIADNNVADFFPKFQKKEVLDDDTFSKDFSKLCKQYPERLVSQFALNFLVKELNILECFSIPKTDLFSLYKKRNRSIKKFPNMFKFLFYYSNFRNKVTDSLILQAFYDYFPLNQVKTLFTPLKEHLPGESLFAWWLHFINKKYAIFSSHRFLTEKEKSILLSYGEKTEKLLFKKSPILLEEVESMLDSYDVYQYEYDEDEPDYQKEIDVLDEELEEEHMYLQDEHPWDFFDEDDINIFVKYLAKAEQYYIREAKFLRKQLAKPSSLIKSRRSPISFKRLASKTIMPRSKMFLADFLPILTAKKYYLNTSIGGYYNVEGHESFKYGPLVAPYNGPDYSVEKKHIFSEYINDFDLRSGKDRAVDYIQEKDFFIYLEICQKEEQKFLLPIFYNLFVNNLTEFFFYYNLEKKIKALSFCVSYFIHYGERLETIFSPIMNWVRILNLFFYGRIFFFLDFIKKKRVSLLYFFYFFKGIHFLFTKFIMLSRIFFFFFVKFIYFYKPILLLSAIKIKSACFIAFLKLQDFLANILINFFLIKNKLIYLFDCFIFWIKVEKPINKQQNLLLQYYRVYKIYLKNLSPLLSSVNRALNLFNGLFGINWFERYYERQKNLLISIHVRNLKRLSFFRFFLVRLLVFLSDSGSDIQQPSWIFFMPLRKAFPFLKSNFYSFSCDLSVNYNSSTSIKNLSSLFNRMVASSIYVYYEEKNIDKIFKSKILFKNLKPNFFPINEEFYSILFLDSSYFEQPRDVNSFPLFTQRFPLTIRPKKTQIALLIYDYFYLFFSSQKIKLSKLLYILLFQRLKEKDFSSVTPFLMSKFKEKDNSSLAFNDVSNPILSLQNLKSSSRIRYILPSVFLEKLFYFFYFPSSFFFIEDYKDNIPDLNINFAFENSNFLNIHNNSQFYNSFLFSTLPCFWHSPFFIRSECAHWNENVMVIDLRKHFFLKKTFIKNSFISMSNHQLFSSFPFDFLNSFVGKGNKQTYLNNFPFILLPRHFSYLLSSLTYRSPKPLYLSWLSFRLKTSFYTKRFLFPSNNKNFFSNISRKKDHLYKKVKSFFTFFKKRILLLVKDVSSEKFLKLFFNNLQISRSKITVKYKKIFKENSFKSILENKEVLYNFFLNLEFIWTNSFSNNNNNNKLLFWDFLFSSYFFDASNSLAPEYSITFYNFFFQNYFKIIKIMSKINNSYNYFSLLFRNCFFLKNEKILSLQKFCTILRSVDESFIVSTSIKKQQSFLQFCNNFFTKQSFLFKKYSNAIPPLSFLNSKNFFLSNLNKTETFPIFSKLSSPTIKKSVSGFYLFFLEKYQDFFFSFFKKNSFIKNKSFSSVNAFSVYYSFRNFINSFFQTKLFNKIKVFTGTCYRFTSILWNMMSFLQFPFSNIRIEGLDFFSVLYKKPLYNFFSCKNKILNNYPFVANSRVYNLSFHFSKDLHFVSHTFLSGNYQFSKSLYQFKNIKFIKTFFFLSSNFFLLPRRSSKKFLKVLSTNFSKYLYVYYYLLSTKQFFGKFFVFFNFFFHKIALKLQGFLFFFKSYHIFRRKITFFKKFTKKNCYYFISPQLNINFFSLTINVSKFLKNSSFKLQTNFIRLQFSFQMFVQRKSFSFFFKNKLNTIFFQNRYAILKKELKFFHYFNFFTFIRKRTLFSFYFSRNSFFIPFFFSAFISFSKLRIYFIIKSLYYNILLQGSILLKKKLDQLFPDDELTFNINKFPNNILSDYLLDQKKENYLSMDFILFNTLHCVSQNAFSRRSPTAFFFNFSKRWKKKKLNSFDSTVLSKRNKKIFPIFLYNTLNFQFFQHIFFLKTKNILIFSFFNFFSQFFNVGYAQFFDFKTMEKCSRFNGKFFFYNIKYFFFFKKKKTYSSSFYQIFRSNRIFFKKKLISQFLLRFKFIYLFLQLNFLFYLIGSFIFFGNFLIRVRNVYKKIIIFCQFSLVTNEIYLLWKILIIYVLRYKRSLSFFRKIEFFFFFQMFESFGAKQFEGRFIFPLFRHKLPIFFLTKIKNTIGSTIVYFPFFNIFFFFRKKILTFWSFILRKKIPLYVPRLYRIFGHFYGRFFKATRWENIFKIKKDDSILFFLILQILSSFGFLSRIWRHSPVSSGWKFAFFFFRYDIEKMLLKSEVGFSISRINRFFFLYRFNSHFFRNMRKYSRLFFFFSRTSLYFNKYLSLKAFLPLKHYIFSISFVKFCINLLLDFDKVNALSEMEEYPVEKKVRSLWEKYEFRWDIFARKQTLIDEWNKSFFFSDPETKEKVVCLGLPYHINKTSCRLNVNSNLNLPEEFFATRLFIITRKHLLQDKFFYRFLGFFMKYDRLIFGFLLFKKKILLNKIFLKFWGIFWFSFLFQFLESKKFKVNFFEKKTIKLKKKYLNHYDLIYFPIKAFKV